jgi:hypothetical protein
MSSGSFSESFDLPRRVECDSQTRLDSRIPQIVPRFPPLQPSLGTPKKWDI